MTNTAAKVSWLTLLGRQEIKLVKELGWDHPEVLLAIRRFRNAYQNIQKIRNSYNIS